MADWRRVATTNTPSRIWTYAVAPKLGNTVTEITQTGPQQLVMIRKSHLGFTGFASALGTPADIDQFGCAALLASIGSGPFFPDIPGGRRAGIDSNACSVPCQTTPTASLAFDRQHELTQTVAAAFFDAYLVGDRSARCWIARNLTAENPDVEVESRR